MNVSSFKKWLVTIICTVLAILIACVGLVVYVDPFFAYHKPISGLYYPYDDVMYQGAGIVKNFDYNILIAGTSLIQNMKASTVESLFGGTAVKVPLCGMSFSKTARLIELAVEHNPKLNMVIVNLDRGQLINPNNSDDTNFPDYLYDNNLFNDSNYLINKSIVVKKSIECILNPENKEQENFDSAFSSEKQFYFAEYVVKTHSIQKENRNFEKEYDFVKENIKLYRDLIVNNPAIDFEIIIPPKSIMNIKELQENGAIDFEIKILTEAVRDLIEYDNVNIHMFQDDLEIIGNLYNYCDFQHFSSKVSDDILFAIKNQTDLLTKENYIDEILKIKTISETFDYSVFSEAEYPIKGEIDINRYLDMIVENEKYEIYISCYDAAALNVTDDIKKKFHQCGINVENILRNGSDFNQRKENMNNKCEFGNNGEIFINGIDYSLKLPGINIVVFDKDLERVIDSSNFNGVNLSECLRTKSIRKD